MQTAADLANLEDATITVRQKSASSRKAGKTPPSRMTTTIYGWLRRTGVSTVHRAGATYKIEFNEWKSKDGVLFRKIENALAGRAGNSSTDHPHAGAADQRHAILPAERRRRTRNRCSGAARC